MVLRLSIPLLPVLALAAVTFASSSVPARAVDLPPAPVLDDEEEALGSGWYLRGDAALTTPSLSRRSRDALHGDLFSRVNSRLERSASLGLGVGYQFAPWFRADVTADHRFASTFRGTNFARAGGAVQDRADLETNTLLLNAYLDLPLFSGLTPYVGAGIGAGQIRFDDLARDGAPMGVSQSDTIFVWAVMAGMSLDITPSFKLDFGYRYSRFHADGIGRAAAFRPRSLGAHELRVGARYMFN